MTEPTLKIGTTGYKLNPEKLKGAPQSVYVTGEKIMSGGEK